MSVWGAGDATKNVGKSKREQKIIADGRTSAAKKARRGGRRIG